jgi:hypothetical protein
MSNSATIIDHMNSSQGQQSPDPIIHQHHGNSLGHGNVGNNNNNNAASAGNNTANTANALVSPNNTVQSGGQGGGGGGIADNNGTATILARLKELEATNQQLAKHLDDIKAETQRKEDKIKLLSADKRKDMEQMIETAIDTWLNSLTGISDEVRKQFRSGVSRIAEQADLKNAAWEVVCQASQLHRANVDRIEELLQTCNSQNETIKSLVGGGSASGIAHDPTFTTEASRMLNANNKRQRVDDPPHAATTTGAAPGGGSTTAAAAGPKDAWDMFDSMLREDSRSQYYSY